MPVRPMTNRDTGVPAIVFAALVAAVAASAAVTTAQSRLPGQEAVSLTGRPLVRPVSVGNQSKLEDDLRRAEGDAAARPDDPEAVIWLGRRQAYLWRYQDAIATFSRGLSRWPDNAKLYRHRGHRFITVRAFARAQQDLERAAQLIRGKADEIEPDGAPNAAGVPRSTLHFNIWYHLGLVRYLQADYAGAHDAYVECLKVSGNDDSVVATSDWMWMTLMRLGRKADADRVLQRIRPTMDILENAAYHRRLLMYKRLERPDALLDRQADDTTVATQGYGVGNFYLVSGNRELAYPVFERVVSGAGWNAFGFIAAEADLARR